MQRFPQQDPVSIGRIGIPDRTHCKRHGGDRQEVHGANLLQKLWCEREERNLEDDGDDDAQAANGITCVQVVLEKQEEQVLHQAHHGRERELDHQEHHDARPRLHARAHRHGRVLRNGVAAEQIVQHSDVGDLLLLLVDVLRDGRCGYAALHGLVAARLDMVWEDELPRGRPLHFSLSLVPRRQVHHGEEEAPEDGVAHVHDPHPNAVLVQQEAEQET
mmetsp:Transcript_11826/g.44034  ORF Transcript_11826/g.44034 Transcript_11826/m.44034 type:complete len:218 (+) Transcript_11826:1079-1732(+)